MSDNKMLSVVNDRVLIRTKQNSSLGYYELIASSNRLAGTAKKNISKITLQLEARDANQEIDEELVSKTIAALERVFKENAERLGLQPNGISKSDASISFNTINHPDTALRQLSNALSKGERGIKIATKQEMEQEMQNQPTDNNQSVPNIEVVATASGAYSHLDAATLKHFGPRLTETHRSILRGFVDKGGLGEKDMPTVVIIAKKYFAEGAVADIISAIEKDVAVQKSGRETSQLPAPVASPATVTASTEQKKGKSLSDLVGEKLKIISHRNNEMVASEQVAGDARAELVNTIKEYAKNKPDERNKNELKKNIQEAANPFNRSAATVSKFVEEMMKVVELYTAAVDRQNQR